MRAEQAPLDWDSPGLIAGVDEAGRGPLAGPVVAAAVILNPAKRIRGLADSKVLTPLKRARLHDEIMDKALCCAIALATVQEIDTLNILQATLLAMRRAVESLRLPPALACGWGTLSRKSMAPVSRLTRTTSNYSRMRSLSLSPFHVRANP